VAALERGPLGGVLLGELCILQGLPARAALPSGLSVRVGDLVHLAARTREFGRVLLHAVPPLVGRLGHGQVGVQESDALVDDESARALDVLPLLGEACRPANHAQVLHLLGLN